MQIAQGSCVGVGFCSWASADLITLDDRRVKEPTPRSAGAMSYRQVHFFMLGYLACDPLDSSPSIKN